MLCVVIPLQYGKSVSALSVNVMVSRMNELVIGSRVRIEYLQPFNGAGALRWKVGTVTKVTGKWVLLSDSHRGGWLPVDGIKFVTPSRV